MVTVEVEEGEEFVACEVPEGKVGLDQCKSIICMKKNTKLYPWQHSEHSVLLIFELF